MELSGIEHLLVSFLINWISGRRNPAEYIERKSMGDRSLLSDYRFLEDGSRRLHSLHREINHEMFKPYPKSNRKSLCHQVFTYSTVCQTKFITWRLHENKCAYHSILTSKNTYYKYRKVISVESPNRFIKRRKNCTFWKRPWLFIMYQNKNIINQASFREFFLMRLNFFLQLPHYRIRQTIAQSTRLDE